MITLPLFFLFDRLLQTLLQAFILLVFFILSERQQRKRGQTVEPGEGAVQTLLKKEHTRLADAKIKQPYKAMGKNKLLQSILS